MLKKGVRIPLIIIGSLLLLLILINIIAPPIAKSYFEKHSKEIVGRQINVDKVRLNIFRGKVSLIGMKAWEANDTDLFVSFDTLVVNASLSRLLANELRLTEITLINPMVSIWQDKSTFNFSDIIDRFSSEKKDKDTLQSSLAVDLRKITLARGSVVYRDLQRNSKFDACDLSLAVPRLYFSGERKSDIGLHLKFADGGDLAVKMLYGLQNNNYDLHVALKDFSVAMAKPYVKEFINLGDFNGKLTADLNISGCLDHILEVVVDGVVNLNSLKITTVNNGQLVDVDQINIDIDQIDVRHQKFYFKEFSMAGLNFLYEVGPSYNTLSQLLAKSDEATVAEPESEATAVPQDSAASKPIDFRIAKTAITRSTVTYADHTLKEALSLPITDIAISAETVSLNELFSVQLKALVGSGGQVAGTWTGTLADLSNQKLKVMIDNVKLKDFSPYSVHYLAYPITDGLLSFSTDNVIKNNYILSENRVDIYKCMVGKKLKDVKPEHNIPLKAAVYVLTDRKGKIAIDLPVKGDISSPNFSFKKIIFKTLGNFLLKVVASPIDMIINAIGASPDLFLDLQYDLTKDDIPTETYAHLNAMTEAMKSKPEMVLTVQQTINMSEVRDFYANQRATTDSVVVEETINQRIGHYEMMLKDYFVSQGIPDSNIEMLPPVNEKTPKGKSILSFGVKLPEGMLEGVE